MQAGRYQVLRSLPRGSRPCTARFRERHGQAPLVKASALLRPLLPQPAVLQLWRCSEDSGDGGPDCFQPPHRRRFSGPAFLARSVLISLFFFFILSVSPPLPYSRQHRPSLLLHLHSTPSSPALTSCSNNCSKTSTIRYLHRHR